MRATPPLNYRDWAPGQRAFHLAGLRILGYSALRLPGVDGFPENHDPLLIAVVQYCRHRANEAPEVTGH